MATFGGLLFGGRVADAYGRRHTILLVAGVFILGTLGCVLAPSVQFLIGARFALAPAIALLVGMIFQRRAPAG